MTEDFLRDPVTRRAFLARMTAAGLGTAAAALLAGCGGGSGSSGSSNTNTPGTGLTTFADQADFPNIPGQNINLVVLNFALTLETLEADLYRQALNVAAGVDINAALPASASGYTLKASTAGLSTTGAAAGFAYLQQFAYVEAAHRDFLRTAIAQSGGTPVPPNPKGYSAASAGLVPGGSLQTILNVILTAEETGVQAYLGAAPFLNVQSLVEQASSIYSTESRHSAVINLSLGNIDLGPSLDQNNTPSFSGAIGAPGPSGKFGGAQPAAAPAGDTNAPLLPGTAEFAKTPKQILAAVQPFFVV